MKQVRKLDLKARLFTQALQSALGTGSSSRKDRITSKENLQKAEEKTAPATDRPNIPRLKSTEEMAPSFENLNQMKIDGDGTSFAYGNETNSTLVNNTFDSQPWEENNNLSTIQENAMIFEAQSAFATDVPSFYHAKDMVPSLDIPIQLEYNSNEYSFPTHYAVDTNQSLLRSISDPQPWMETNHLSTIQETWNDNLKIPAEQSGFTTYWPAVPETKAEDVSQQLYIPNHLEINDNLYSSPANHADLSPSWATDPSDLHNWIHNCHLASIQETLCMVPENENDVWIRKNRLRALQQIGCNALDQYSSSINLSPPYSSDSSGEMCLDMMNLSGCWHSPIVSAQSSTNSLSSGSNSLKDMPVYDGKYKFESPIPPHQGMEMKSEWSQDMNMVRKSAQEHFDFPRGEQAVCVNDGKTQFARKNRSNSFEGSSPERQSLLQNLPVKNSKAKSSSIDCCATFHDKPSPKNNKNVATLPSYDAKSLRTLESSTGFYDSHCHLDLLFNRENFRGTYADYMAEHKATYPKSYNGCIAVFCKPFTFAKKHVWQKHLDQDNVWGAFGCHPKSARFYDDRIEKDLEVALGHPKVRALGEIGLDYSIGNECSRWEQQYVFRRQLQIAQRRKLRLVIHCRDADEDTIKIMHEIVPKDTIFHLHCFTGNWEKAQMWMREFPNLFIGITNLVTFPSAVETHEVARNLPLDYLLLETDAPYFVPSMVPKSTQFSHPGMAIHVAAQIAALKEIPVEKVLQWTSANTKIVYRLP